MRKVGLDWFVGRECRSGLAFQSGWRVEGDFSGKELERTWVGRRRLRQVAADFKGLGRAC